MNFALRSCCMIPVLIMGLAVMSCASTNNAGELAGVLAERLTDKLEVDGGALIDAPAPATGSSGEIPVITGINAPAFAVMEQSFDVLVTTDYSDPARINRAVVEVEGSIRHIHAAGVSFDGTIARISMVVHQDDALVRGNLYPAPCPAQRRRCYR